jgi:hypothetical protein
LSSPTAGHRAAPKSAPLPWGHWGPYGERNQLFANEGGRFRDISLSNPALCGRPNVARGLAVGDINGDGGPDVVLTTAGGRARVFTNVAARGHWLNVRALERSGVRDALGAEVVIHASGRRQIRVLQTADSYLSASEAVVHFGLGKEESYDGVEVRWPGGDHERFPGGKADRLLVLREGSGQRRASPWKGKP